MSNQENKKYAVEISNPEKILFPDIKLTKTGLAEYYERIAEYLLPHTQGRPISMERYPDGIANEGFYQKEVPAYFPEWISRIKVRVESDNREQEQMAVNQKEELVYLADQACISIHTWLSRKGKLDYPDKIIFDLDPPSNNFDMVIAGAKTIRAVLEAMNLSAYVMTSGSRGLHVAVPIKPESDFDTVRQFAKDTANYIVQKNPDAFTIEFSKDKRKGRLLIDYLRNSYAQTSIAPYAVRARTGAPIATPLRWQELDLRGLSAQKYTVNNIFRRLGQMSDPWQHFFRDAASIKEARKFLNHSR